MYTGGGVPSCGGAEAVVAAVAVVLGQVRHILEALGCIHDRNPS
jgi:hypothetical protein